MQAIKYSDEMHEETVVSLHSGVKSDANIVEASLGRSNIRQGKCSGFLPSSSQPREASCIFRQVACKLCVVDSTSRLHAIFA